jgi:hypothetical protein
MRPFWQVVSRIDGGGTLKQHANAAVIRGRPCASTTGWRARANDRGASHENGSIEARRRTLKRFADQAPLLRGSRDFDSAQQYRLFIADVVERANGRVG